MQHPVIDLIGKWPVHLLKFLIITIKHKAIYLKYLKFLDPCIFWLSRSSTWQSCPSNESELVALILKRFSASLYFLLDDSQRTKLWIAQSFSSFTGWCCPGFITLSICSCKNPSHKGSIKCASCVFPSQPICC